MSWRYVALVFVLLIMFQRLATAGEDPPGMLADVGGYRLHIYCLGQGSPAVILDAGLGGSSQDWKRVQSGLAATTRVCIYDRAGYGWSDPGPLPRTSSRIASELRTLLTRAGIPPPYVLAGHSFGGYNMRLFSSFFPRETVGLVLVDSLHEGQADGFFKSQIMRQIDPQGLLQYLWRPEILSVLSIVDLEPITPLFGLKAKTLRAIMGEMAALKESGTELSAADLQLNIPLVVIMHGRRVLPEGILGDQMEQEWSALQRNLASRYKNSSFIVAKDSAHEIPLDQPELVIDAIRGVVDTERRQGLSGSRGYAPR
jgi:Predicted hydrolases or acyltransferases (alpha/beta hydrolase superfamily)